MNDNLEKMLFKNELIPFSCQFSAEFAFMLTLFLDLTYGPLPVLYDFLTYLLPWAYRSVVNQDQLLPKLKLISGCTIG